jgi:hypothetical protein
MAIGSCTSAAGSPASSKATERSESSKRWICRVAQEVWDSQNQVLIRPQLITQRFKLPGADKQGEVEVDVECQNRFTYLLEKDPKGDWKCACELIVAWELEIPA